MHAERQKVKINMGYFLKLISILFLVQLSFALMTILAPVENALINSLYRRFAFDSELSVPALFSFGLLLLCSLLLALIAVQQRGAQCRWHRHWVGLACLFLVLAYDEAAGLHERLIEPLRNQFGVGGALYFAWVIPGLALVTLIGLIYVPFLIHLPPLFCGLFVLSAATYVGGALGVEMIGGRYVDQHLAEGDNAQIMADFNYQIITTIEESMEMIGTIIFIYALMKFLNVQNKVLMIYLGMKR